MATEGGLDSSYMSEYKKLKTSLDRLEGAGGETKSIARTRDQLIAYFNNMSPSQQREIAELYLPKREE